MTPLNSIYGVDSDFFKKEDSDFTKFQRLTNSGCASWACCLKSGSHFLFMKFQCTLTDSQKLFPSNRVLYWIMGMKKNMYYHKSIRFCNEAMGRSSSKSQRRSLQHLVYPPVKFGNKLIAKAGRFRRHSVKFQEFPGMEISVPVDKMFQLPWVQLEFLM